VDQLSGGAGNDTFHVAGDGYSSASRHTYSNFHGASIHIADMAVVEDQIYRGDVWDNPEGTDGADVLNLSLGTTYMESYDDEALRIDSIEEVNLGAGDDILDMDSNGASYTTDMVVDGGSGDDNLWMAQGDDTVYGGSGADRITGDDGDDYIEGGSGADSMDGGSGTDTLSYAGSSSGIEVRLDDGAGRGGDAEGDTFSNFENIQGSAHADELRGDDGDNVIEGGAGADDIRGGDGSDTASYENASSAISANLHTESGSQGDALGDEFDSIENLTGSAFNDTLTGDSSANVLTGGAGNDTLRGYGGNDTLNGGAGNDILIAGEQGGGTVTVDGGSGWIDTLQLQNNDGSDVADGWTINLTNGSIHSNDGDSIQLSDDAAGSITLDDGTTIDFSNIEVIDY